MALFCNYPKPKRMYNKVRTDTLETLIAWYVFDHNYDAADAIRDLAKSIGAPVREIVIDETVSNYKRIATERLGSQSRT